MKKSITKLRDGDEVQTEWAAVAYDLWCRSCAQEYTVYPQLRIVNIYEIVNSVIDNDLSEAEKAAARLHWFDELSVSDTAKTLGTSTANIYKALARSKAKIRLVLKHIINSSEYKTENETIA